jgi:S-adenosylmethionine synthetase
MKNNKIIVSKLVAQGSVNLSGANTKKLDNVNASVDPTSCGNGFDSVTTYVREKEFNSLKNKNEYPAYIDCEYVK